MPPHGPQPRRPGNRGLLVGAAIAALILLVAGGIVVWNVADSRLYASLPTCRQLLDDIAEEIPDADRPRVEGEYTSADDLGYGEDGFLGALQCNVVDSGEDDENVLLYTHVSLYEYEDEGEAVEDLRGDMEEILEDWEDGAMEDEMGWDDAEWMQISAGDGGYTSVYQHSQGGQSDQDNGYGTAYFTTANVTVSLEYPVEGRFDEEETMEFLGDFSRQVDRQLSREGERA